MTDHSRSAPLAAAADFAELRGIIAAFPGRNEAAALAAETREAQLTKPAGALGRLEALARWYIGWRGDGAATLQRPRVAVFAGNHGIAAHGVSAFPQSVTAAMVRNFRSGGAAINQICRLHDAELRVYEMALQHPTRDFLQAPAMEEAECANAVVYGMTAVEDGLDCLCLGEMGIGNSTAAAALAHALFGGAAADWTGPGTGLSGAALQRKTEIVAQAVTTHQAALSCPLQILRHFGGRELAAIVGAIIAARIARTPVILDGFACTAAAAVLERLSPGALDHCIIGHLSAEPGHRRLLQRLGKTPVLQLEMRLGEGSGAALALSVLKTALACHAGMATFAEAGIPG